MINVASRRTVEDVNPDCRVSRGSKQWMRDLGRDGG